MKQNPTVPLNNRIDPGIKQAMLTYKRKTKLSLREISEYGFLRLATSCPPGSPALKKLKAHIKAEKKKSQDK